MLRTTVFGLALAILAGEANSVLAQDPAAALIGQPAAQRHGLRRAWFTQIGVDRTRSKVMSWKLHNDRLYVQTRLNALYCLDAETGRKLWSTQVGEPGMPSGAPAANDAYAASVNSKWLHVFDATDGHEVWKRELVAIPLAGPAMSAEWVFTTMSNGMMSAHNLQNPDSGGWTLGVGGRAEFPAEVSENGVYFANHRGMVLASDLIERDIQFQVETEAAVTAPLAAGKEYLYVPNDNKTVLAIGNQRGASMGRILWQFPTGGAVLQRPAVVGDSVFFARHLHGLYRVQARGSVEERGDDLPPIYHPAGQMQWYAAGATEFVAASKKRVYAATNEGRLLILDGASGAKVGSLSTELSTLKYLNDKNDRIYLATESGLIQCLREIDQEKPIWHNREAEEEAGAIQQPGAEPEGNPENQENQEQ